MKRFNQTSAIAAVSLSCALLLTGCNGKTPPAETAPATTSVVTQAPEESPTATPEETKDVSAEETIFIVNGDHEIPAIVTMPENASAQQPVPVVVLLHGTGSQKNEAGDGYKMLAPKLAQAGIASIRIDFMGSGESEASDADFNFQNAREDALAAADYMMKLDTIDSEKVGILGWSQGGIHALLTAAADDRFAAVVTWAAPVRKIEVSEEDRATAAEQGYYTVEYDWREPMQVGQQWIDDVDNTDLTDEIPKIKAPILALNGTADDVVAPENSSKIKSLAQHTLSDAVLIENADHTFNLFSEDMTAYDALTAHTVSFFEEQFFTASLGDEAQADTEAN